MIELPSDPNESGPSGILLTPLGTTRLLTPRNSRGFTSEELSDIVQGQITLIQLTNEEKPRRRRRIMCVNAEGKDLKLEFNSKAFIIFEVPCWGLVFIMNFRYFLA